MKKLLIALACGLGLSAAAAQHMAPSLINGAGIVCSNNFTVQWNDTNVLVAGPSFATSQGTTPFPIANNTNAPATNFISLPVGAGYPLYNLYYTVSPNAVVWTNAFNAAGAWNTSATNLSANGFWATDVNPVADANSDVGLAWFTFGTIGNLGNSSNTVAITLACSKVGTNYPTLGADTITVTVTNGLTSTLNSITPTVPTYWSFGLSSNFMACTKSIRIQKIVISSIASSGYITVFDARLPQWVP